ncbi:MAG TPA: RAD55 family ATPase, partial [Thermoplasmata archaeon]|nr:RAD55 family ATPase [Thermoplasmata archaeon]
MKRVSTHIEGLDEVLGGGIPEGNVVLVSGAPGTMKTSLTYHILHSSALGGSRGLYVSLEQGRASLIDHTEGLGYRLDDTHGNLSVLDLGTLRKKLTGSAEQPWLDLFKLYTQGIRKSFDYRFLVLDSLDALEILA